MYKRNSPSGERFSNLTNGHYTGNRGWFLLYRMVERHFSVPKPFANGDANEWFERFNICRRANGWDDARKALKLPTLLEGETIAIWLELDGDTQNSYEDAEKAIKEKIMPMGFISLDEFHRRKVRPG